MQKIVPHLWFDREAKEAAAFYVSVFPNSKITHTSVIHDTPSGDCDVLGFDLMGYSFMSISAGPLFKLNPSISFMVNFDSSKDAGARTRIDEVWGKLAEGGRVLMPLGSYPFSERYGWVEDRYGVSWQLMYAKPGDEARPTIIPSLMFTEAVWGKAEEATDFYISVFKNAKRGIVARYPAGMEPDKEGTIMFTDFTLEGRWFAAMDSAREHGFGFSEAVSLLVNCDTQEEINYYWEKLSAVPAAEQCGWLKDKYGVSWQINATRMDEMLRVGTPEQVARVMKVMLTMKKFNLSALEAAFQG